MVADLVVLAASYEDPRSSTERQSSFFAAPFDGCVFHVPLTGSTDLDSRFATPTSILRPTPPSSLPSSLPPSLPSQPLHPNLHP